MPENEWKRKHKLPQSISWNIWWIFDENRKPTGRKIILQRVLCTSSHSDSFEKQFMRAASGKVKSNPNLAMPTEIYKRSDLYAINTHFIRSDCFFQSCKVVLSFFIFYFVHNYKRCDLKAGGYCFSFVLPHWMDMLILVWQVFNKPLESERDFKSLFIFIVSTCKILLNIFQFYFLFGQIFYCHFLPKLMNSSNFCIFPKCFEFFLWKKK